MKINIIRIISMILLLGNFYIIFQFSSQNGEESGNLSGKIAKFLIKQLPIEETQQSLKKTETIIRKMAHFSIYTLLGFLLMFFMNTYPIKVKEKISISLLVGILYAISDEIHQKFVPGRSCQITDVMIDSLGVTLGIFLLLMLLEIHKKIKINRQNIAKSFN